MLINTLRTSKEYYADNQDALREKSNKFRKSNKDSSQMPGVQYFTNNSNMDTQFLKDQIKKVEDKQNKLLITDMQPNLVNNRLLMDLREDNETIKSGLVKMYNNAGASYNYTYDAINELQSSISNMKNNDGQEMAERVFNILTDPNFKVKGNFEVNKQDNIGDFSNNNNLKDPNIIEQQKQTNNRLSEIYIR